MKILSASGLIAMGSHIAGILHSDSISAVRFACSAIGYLTSLAMFWLALRAAWTRPLAIAFSGAASDSLIEHGPYRWVRHPIYLSYTLAWIAGALAIEGWWPWVVPVLMLTQYLMAIRHEERQFQLGPLALDYARYAKQTGALIPNSWPKRSRLTDRQ